MPKESVQQKLTRVRKPRVHITYDVETGDAIQQKELPFVVGVMADLSGKGGAQLPPMKDRKFVDIDRDNFNQVLAGTRPHLSYKVPNKLAGDDSLLGVNLEFRSMDDFGPEGVAKQVEPVRKLLDARQRLNELSLRINANERLEELLQQVMQDSESLKALGAAGAPQPAEGGEKKEGEDA